jgi:hypothetical protein
VRESRGLEMSSNIRHNGFYRHIRTQISPNQAVLATVECATYEAPRALHNVGLYSYSPHGAAYTETKPAGGGTAGWEAKPVLRCAPSGENPDNAKRPAIHEPRGTRWTDGYDTDQISNEFGSRWWITTCGL